MYLLIVFLPLLGSIFCGFFGRKFGSFGVGVIAYTCVLVSFFISIFIFFEVGIFKTPCYIKLFSWLNTEYFCANWGFHFDSLTSVMLVVVCFISTLVHLYSIEYMAHDPHLVRFMSYLCLFTFFMLILVTSDNFMQLFVGWEGVGLCSYLLINFWFTRLQANKAAIKAMLINRIGDFGLALGIFCIYLTFKSLEFSTVFALISFFECDFFSFMGLNIHSLTLISVLLFVGAVGKSAQLGLHSWLPDAMEGPTPVSALIHAATMVTAGVFLLARCSPIFEYSPNALLLVTVLGAMTAFFAATTGLLQNDIKKVIAYSTCSQLGYMVFACGVSNYSVGMFHLTNHAFFKALLFLGAGSVIHAVSDEQDMRRMGGLKRLLPFTFAVIGIGSFALMGFPFLAGFYSKDVILEVTFAKYNTSSHFAYCLGTFAAFFTAFYSMRLTFLTFLAEPNGFKTIILGAHDSRWKMAIPLFILSIPSIFIGYFLKDMFIGVGSAFWNNSIFILPLNLNIFDAEFAPQFFKILPVCFSILGAFLALFFYTFMSKDLFSLKISMLGRICYTFLNKKWFFDKFYNEFLNQAALTFGFYVTYKILDRGLIEMIGPFGLTKIIFFGSKKIAKQQIGSFYIYAFWIFFGLAFMLCLINFSILFIDLSLLLIFLIVFFL